MRILIIIAACLFISSSDAQVNIKNGNFYVSYTDAKFAGTQGAIGKIQRTYNSKSNEIGWFGYGWGSRLETKLVYYPDGNVKVKEYGAGGINVFTSALQDDLLAEEMIDLIIDVEIDNDILSNTPTLIAKQTEKYTSTNERFAAYEKYLKKNYIEPNIDIPEGISWQSFNRGDQQLVFENNQFIRTNSSGEKEYFDLKGHMVKYELKNGYYTEIIFKNNKVAQLRQKNGLVIDFKTTSKGYIEQINYTLNDEEKEAIFTYENDNLISSKDTGGYHYEFVYDKKHNMTQTIYNPVRFKGEPIDARYMFYQDNSNFISKIISRDSSEIKEYKYNKYYKESGEIDDFHYGTEVKTTLKDELPETSSYEYYIGQRANGSTYSRKIITKYDGITKSQTYDETCTNQPTRIEIGEQWTNFKYDKNCNLLEKEKSTGEYVRLKYHPSLKKMIEVQQDENTFYYKYDERGNIIYGKKNEDPPVYFTYNKLDQILTMKNGETTMNMEYNAIGKPTKIAIKDVGEINVTYDNNGEIERVDSSDGAKMTLLVTQSFQNLLQIVKPANLDYNL